MPSSDWRKATCRRSDQHNCLAISHQELALPRFIEISFNQLEVAFAGQSGRSANQVKFSCDDTQASCSAGGELMLNQEACGFSRVDGGWQHDAGSAPGIAALSSCRLRQDRPECLSRWTAEQPAPHGGEAEPACRAHIA